MFGTFALTALFASSLLVRADVVPSVPGPGVTYNTGATCHIEWDGDKDSTTAWKNMAIELMTGSNFGMVHLTTVATGQDGSVSGFFDHPCPAVIPNSAIYFYQFTAPGSPDKQWATRFTIASTTGASVPPANAIQPTSNEAIPWGTGALANPGSATPPPASANSTDGPPPVSSSTSNTVSSSSTGTLPPTVPSTTSSSTRTSSVTTSSTSTPSTPSNTTTNASTKGNAASASVTVDSRVWRAAVALSASAMAFAVLL